MPLSLSASVGPLLGGRLSFYKIQFFFAGTERPRESSAPLRDLRELLSPELQLQPYGTVQYSVFKEITYRIMIQVTVS